MDCRSRLLCFPCAGLVDYPCLKTLTDGRWHVAHYLAVHGAFKDCTLKLTLQLRQM